MNSVTLSDVRKELAHVPAATLQEMCLRMARFKKENKELLTYLLFEAHDEGAYIAKIKEELDELFAGVNQTNVYFIKKNLRRILRTLNKQIRYSGIKQTELELRIHFCRRMNDAGMQSLPSQVIVNLYSQQLKKINTVLEKLPEDLQYDYHSDIETLK